jgi:micrococcal nuclease
MNYEFKTSQYRAQCLNVVDGDTVDLFVDQGFRGYQVGRFRLYAIDTCELNSSDPAKREQALAAKEKMIEWLHPASDGATVNLRKWPCRIESFRDPDNFGRWLANIYYLDQEGLEHFANGELLEVGLAVPYKR